jgi:hypothetical protein
MKGLELEVRIKQRSFFLLKRKTVWNERMIEKKEREITKKTQPPEPSWIAVVNMRLVSGTTLVR